MKQNQKVVIKQEPIGMVKKKKAHEEKTKKKLSIRCGDNYSPEQLDKCPAKSKKCNYCKRTGHIQKVCQKKLRDERKKDKRSSKIGVVDEEDTDNSEGDEEDRSTDSSDTTTSNTNSDDNSNAENCGRVREVTKVPFRRNKRGDLIARAAEIKPKNGKTEKQLSLS